MIFLSTLLGSVLLTALAVPVFSRLALRYSLVDVPNERKVHKEPVPRIGGLAMALGMVPPISYWIGGDGFVKGYMAGAAVLILFGLLDDCRDLPPRWKLFGQGCAAYIAVVGAGVRISSLGMLAPDGFLLPSCLAIPLTIFVIVGVTNAINLSDGLDGLAGGISLLSLCCISYLAYLEQEISIAVIALALAGATFAFLRYNTYPASIFMGDTGSQLLGFSCITLALSLTQGNAPLSPVLPLIILGFPVLDTLTVMFGRIARGRSPFSADKTHFHHTLLELWLHQSESVMMIYLIQVGLIAVAFLCRSHSDLLLCGLYLCFSISVIVTFSLARSRKWQLKRLGPAAAVDGCFARLHDIRLIKWLFRPLEVGLITVLLLTAFLNGRVPLNASLAAVATMVVLAFVSRYFPQLLGDCLKVTLYLVIPLIIYQSATRLQVVASPLPVMLYRLLFGGLALLNILVSRLTRRVHGFQSTPLDFLVLFIALTAPQLPQSVVPLYISGIIAAKIIICYFSCEIVCAESRGELRRLTLGTLALLVILGMRGFL